MKIYMVSLLHRATIKLHDVFANTAREHMVPKMTPVFTGRDIHGP